MSSPIKKKTRKRKKKSQIEDIKPQKHEKVGNLNLFSEEISKTITEKIISLVFSDIYNKRFESKINDFCYDSSKRMFDNIMELTNVNHDNDDFDIDKIEINSYIKYINTDTNIKRYKIKIHNKVKEYKNGIAKENLYNSIDVPKDFESYINSPNKKINDHLNKSTLVENNKYLSKGKSYQYSIDVEKNNFWGNISCPQVSDIDRTSSNHNNFIQKKDNDKDKPNRRIIHTKKNSNVPDKKKSFLKKNTFSYKNIFASNLSKNFGIISKDKSKINLIGSVTPRGRSAKIIDMKSYPLENLEIRKEIEGISELRKEVIELEDKKVKALKKKIIIIKEKKKEDIEKEKRMKNGKFTVDNDGNIIFINEIKQDKLPKEFWSVTSKQKEIKPAKTIDIIKKEKIKMENNAEKNIIYNKEEKTPNLIPYLIKARLTNPQINLSNLSEFMMLNNFNFDKDEDNINKFKNKYSDLFLMNNFKKGKEDHSGSNFSLMNPSVGVKIRERNKEKSGGNDFFKEFHKYSINDFNKTLQDNIGWENMMYNKKKKDEFNPNATSELPNLKKNNLLKNMIKEENEAEKGAEQNNTEINILTAQNDFNQKIKNKGFRNRNSVTGINNTKKNNIKNTTTTNITNIRNFAKKTMYKSSSELFLENEKFIKLKEALFTHNHNEIYSNQIMPYKNKQTDIRNLCEYKIQSSMRNRSKKVFLIKNNYKDIDTFNKNIMMGSTVHQKVMNGKMILPQISFKNNEINFNRTMLNFSRDRTKKSIWEEYIQKKENDSKRKKFKKINIVKK